MVYNITRTSPIVFGVGAVEQVGTKAKEHGCGKVMLVTDAGIKNAGIAAEVRKYLEAAGVGVVEYDKVPSDPPDNIIEEAAGIARSEQVDGVVGVGGGSVLDAAKGVNVLLTNPPPITNYYGVFTAKNPGKVLILLPTTSGTGSEVTAISVVTNSRTQKKSGVIGPYCMSTVAIVDPALTVKMPPALTAGTGMDAFSHAAEALTSGFANPVSGILAERAVELIYKYLPVAVENGDDMEARINMSLASMLAGIAFNDALPHYGHAIAHTAGAHFHVHHGMVCGLALPVVLEFVADAVPEKVKIIARCMGLEVSDAISPQEAGRKVREAIQAFTARIGMKTFKDAGIAKADLEAIAADVLTDDCAAFGPKKITVEDARKLLSEMYV
ncbi:iron-containing alcohol dehydrogenase [Moorella sulfitireducens (nom. illeg.)]|uniref:iron-containing alcohol dehydrogenase n=1 Tax=Neomoorella sulfitireducens TaxID=2972948 RepID=UPI0021ABA001|nr:iron-containing alcohol dehydrogenase [Moorella sulfitireducens]